MWIPELYTIIHRRGRKPCRIRGGKEDVIKIANKKKSADNNNSDIGTGCLLIAAAIALFPFFLSFWLSTLIWSTKKFKMPKWARALLIVAIWALMLSGGLFTYNLQQLAKEAGETTNAAIYYWLIACAVQGVPCLLLREPKPKDAAPVAAPAPGPAGVPPLYTRAPAEPADLKKLHDYVVVDTETTGLSRQTDEMLEIAIITVAGDQIVEEYSTLIHPTIPIPAEASAVNGLTDADFVGAPYLADVLPEIRRRLDGKTIIGHNVTFDLGFIANALAAPEQPADLLYIDTLNLSRQCIRAKTHKLQTLATQLGLDPGQAHRALGDARTTFQLYQYCVRKLNADADEERRLRAERRRINQAAHDAEFAWSPLNNKNFAFSGDFLTDREHLEELVHTVGANKRDKVNSKTDYLVTGDLSNLPDWALARKSGKANDLIAAGQHITRLTESEYIALIQSTTALKPADETDFNQ